MSRKLKIILVFLLAIMVCMHATGIATKEKYLDSRKRGIEWLMSQPNIIMSGGCRGMGVDSFNLSFHKSYAEYDEWLRSLRLEMGDLIEDIQSVLVNLSGKELLKPLHLKYLTEAEETSED